MAERAKNWTPPDGLGYSSLRPVRLNGGGKVLVLLAAVLLLGGIVAGLWLDRISRRQGVETELLAEKGLQTQARIVRVWESGDTRRRGKSDSRYRVTYTFDHAGGRYTRSSRVPYVNWQTLREGGTLSVRYLPTQPEISRPVEWEERPVQWWAGILTGGMLMMTGPLLVLPVRKQYLLLAEGRPAPGSIVELKAGDKGTLIVKYEFPLLSGAMAKGKTSLRKAPIEPLCVLYDPDNPRRNALYPMSLVRLAK